MEINRLQLRIIDRESALLHEETDAKRVERLEIALEQSDILKNPPIASPILREGATHYVILDGATRTTALQKLKYRYLLVQVEDYALGHVGLEAWYHVVSKEKIQSVRDSLRKIENCRVEESRETEAREALKAGKSCGYLVGKDGVAISLHPSQFDLSPAILKEVVKSYAGTSEIYRVVQSDLHKIIDEGDPENAVFVFPTFSPNEIQQFSLNKNLLPAGITRHIIPGRALHVNLPLSALMEGGTVEEKNNWLDDWLTRKIFERKVRYYHEPVFLFDD